MNQVNRAFNFLTENRFGNSIWGDLKLHLTERYKLGTSRLLGQTIEYTDAASFIASRREIFLDDIYNFKNSSEQPLIIDCGANIGLSIIYFKTKYPKSRIIGYEPDVEIFETLQRNIALFDFDSVSIFNSAIWTDNNGISFKSEGGLSGHVTDDPVGQYVDSIRLKSIIEEYTSIDLLKIDIEGAEHNVLPDISDSLTHIKYIFLEYHSIVGAPQKLDSILGIFSKANFRYYIQNAFTSAKPFCSVSTQAQMDLQLNIFAINERFK